MEIVNSRLEHFKPLCLPSGDPLIHLPFHKKNAMVLRNSKVGVSRLRNIAKLLLDSKARVATDPQKLISKMTQWVNRMIYKTTS